MKCMSELQTGKIMSLIWVCGVCLGLFYKQLVFKVLEHLPYPCCPGYYHYAENQNRRADWMATVAFSSHSIVTSLVAIATSHLWDELR